MENKKIILIIGGGFGGVAAALDLEKKCGGMAKIVLVSDKPHFEYQPALYRVVTGESPLQVCIQLADIFGKKKIECDRDTIISVDIKKREAAGASGSRYKFDYLILALGSETAYYGVPGIEKFSYGFKSIAEALKLKTHLHKLFSLCKRAKSEAEKARLLQFVVVGAGATGVELSGELLQYAKKLAKEHKVNPKNIAIDLVDSAPRILPAFSEKISQKISRRLESLGVKIFTNKKIEKENIVGLKTDGKIFETKTVVWTAGVKPNILYGKISGFQFDKKGRVLVDKFGASLGAKNIFIAGDGASTPYSGMAQTAILDGRLAAGNIARLLRGKKMRPARPKKPYYAIPVGPGWSLAIAGPFTFFGRIGWWLRRAADLRFFLSILPLGKALDAFIFSRTICESCEICEKNA